MIGPNTVCPCRSGKKYKNCCMSKNHLRKKPLRNSNIKQDWEKLFFYASALMDFEERYQEAASIFKKIINSEDSSNQLKSGSCINMVGLVQENYNNSPVEKSFKEMEKYLNLALKYNPDNTLVGGYFVYFYLLKLDFANALYWYNKKLSERSIEYVNKVFLKSLYYWQSANFIGLSDKFITVEALEFYKAVFNRGNFPAEAYTILTELLVYGNEQSLICLQKLLWDAEKKYPKSSAIMVSLSQLYREECLNLPNESLEYAKKALDLVEKDKKNKDDLETVTLIARTNIGKSLYSLKRYEEAVQKLEYFVSLNPSNTDLHNLASSYFSLGNYEQSIKYFERCLYIQEDESAFAMLAHNYYKLKRYEEASKYYRKSLSILKGQELTFKSVDENKKDLISFMKPEWINNHLNNIYPNLINTHILLDDLVMAKIFYNEAIEIFEDEPFIYSLGTLIEKMMEQNNKANDLLEKIEFMKIQLYEERLQMKEQGVIVRKWAQSLMETQNKYSELHLLDDKEFYKELESIIEKMKIEAATSLTYKDFLIEVRKEYKFLNKKSLEFLATANYLYEFNKNKLIDFAPVLIAFVKVIEHELINYLQISNTKMTLGSLINFIESKKISPFYNSVDKLKFIHKLRNSAAHTGQTSLEKVEVVRELLLNEILIKFEK